MRNFITLFILLLCYACESYDVEGTLASAEDNRIELEKVLNHYAKEKPDKEKLKAAKFLIANMRWHQSIIDTTSHAILDSIIQQADSTLYLLAQTSSIDSFNTAKYITRIWSSRIKFKINTDVKQNNPPISENSQVKYDHQWITANQLISHIDFIFSVREQSASLKKLSFDDFCEYVLPYRISSDKMIIDFPQKYTKIYNKYLKLIPQDSLQKTLNQFGATTCYLHYSFTINNWKTEYQGGLYNHLFKPVPDCFEESNSTVATMRGYGIPITIEYNTYKKFQGKHFQCSLLNKEGKWERFSAVLPRFNAEDSTYLISKGVMNYYRCTFSAQSNTPPFLRNKEEFIPEEFESPCVKDITSELMKTVSLTLPFNVQCNNHLAYLATYNRVAMTEWNPVTWGKIHKGKVIFHTVVPDRIYALVYYTSAGIQKTVGNPFYIEKSGKIKTLIHENSISRKIIITRKFPSKESVRKMREDLIGSAIIASNDTGFIKKDTIGTIRTLPTPYYQDIKLNMNKGPYRYYRIQASHKESIKIAEIE